MNVLRRAAALLAIGGIFILSGCGRYQAIQRFPLANDVSVNILQEDEWEYYPKLFYTVQEHGAVHVPPTYFDVVGNERLRMMDSGKGVVGFVSTSDPSSVVILFDQRTRESWPRDLASEASQEARMRGERMLCVLRTAFPEARLVLKN